MHFHSKILMQLSRNSMKHKKKRGDSDLSVFSHSNAYASESRLHFRGILSEELQSADHYRDYNKKQEDWFWQSRCTTSNCPWYVLFCLGNWHSQGVWSHHKLEGYTTTCWQESKIDSLYIGKERWGALNRAKFRGLTLIKQVIKVFECVLEGQIRQRIEINVRCSACYI